MQKASPYRLIISLLLAGLFLVPVVVQTVHQVLASHERLSHQCDDGSGTHHAHDPDVLHLHHCSVCTFHYTSLPAFNLLPPARPLPKTLASVPNPAEEWLRTAAHPVHYLRGPPAA